MGPKSKSTLADVILRLDILLKENSKLQTQNDKLAKRVEILELLLTKKFTSKSISVSTNTVYEPHSVPDFTPEKTQKKKMHALLISDSIFRHVGGDCPKKDFPQTIEQDITIPISKTSSHQPITLKKIVIPGANCDRLFSEAMYYAREYEFEHVYCHVGTNYHDLLSPEDTSNEISHFLVRIKELFDCPTTYSPILPRIFAHDQQISRSSPISAHSVQLMRQVRDINSDIIETCQRHQIGTMVCPAFIRDCAPVPDRSLLAQDGCHLSRKGVLEMENTLFEHLKVFFWEYYGNDY